MTYAQIPYLSRSLANKAIIAYVVILSMCLFVFPNKLPLLWIVFGLGSVISFFYFTSLLSARWRNLPSILFRRKVFWLALIIRIIYVVAIFFFYNAKNGHPFEFNSADSSGYHGEALWIIDLIKAGNFEYYFSGYNQGYYSDTGWPLVLALLYSVSFKSIIFSRLVNALLGSWMVVFLYRLGQRNFGESAARITAIMAMLLPTFIYYTGIHLKETTMVFLFVAFAERADFIMRSKQINFWIIIQVILFGLSLFLFRTVLAVAAWFALFSALIFSSNRLIGSMRRISFIIWFAIAAAVIFSGSILNEVEGFAEARKTNQESRLGKFSTGSGANTLASYGSAAIFMPMMIPAPFPTLVKVPMQENAMMLNGANFTRNIYAFFVFIAIWFLYKRKLLKKNVLVLTLLFAYLIILAMSGYALSERFHMPLLPFLLLLAGYGITIPNIKVRRLYIPYIIIIVMVIIGWNWFKLAGRGMI